MGAVVTARLTEVYRDAMGRLRVRAATAAGRAWDALSANTTTPDRFVELVVPLVSAAQAQAAILTDAYVSAAADVPPVGVDLAELEPRLRGVPLEEVYARPFHTTWYDLSKGADVSDALSAGRARAEMAAATDVSLAMRASFAVVGIALGSALSGFVRVSSGSARPSGATASGGSCDLCQSVEGAHYSDAGTLELHPNCGCTLEPVVDGSDEFSAEGSTPSLEETDTVTHDHGELGPMLANRGDEFRQEE